MLYGFKSWYSSKMWAERNGIERLNNEINKVKTENEKGNKVVHKTSWGENNRNEWHLSLVIV